MFGWLAKKNEDARVYMCVKEVKWDIEKSDELRRAVILVMAHIQRIGMSEDEDLKRIIDNPFAFDRRDAVFLYVRLEDLRNTIRLQHDKIRKTMRDSGGWPEYARQHSKDATRGLEICMCTIGAGVNPDVREDVRAIWKMLRHAVPRLDEACAQLRTIETLTALATGSGSHWLFGAIPEGTNLAEEVKFVPSVFRQ